MGKPVRKGAKPAKNITDETRRKKLIAVALNAQGLNQDTVCEVVGINKRMLQRANSKFKKYGDVEGGAKKRGSKGKLHYNCKHVRCQLSAASWANGFKALLQMVLEYPGYTLKKYAEELEKEFGVSLTPGRICQILKEHEYNRKQVTPQDDVNANRRWRKKRKSEIPFFVPLGFESCENTTLNNLFSSMNLASTQSWEDRNTLTAPKEKRSAIPSSLERLRI